MTRVSHEADIVQRAVFYIVFNTVGFKPATILVFTRQSTIYEITNFNSR
jgi:hypothetical protein